MSGKVNISTTLQGMQRSKCSWAPNQREIQFRGRCLKYLSHLNVISLYSYRNIENISCACRKLGTLSRSSYSKVLYRKSTFSSAEREPDFGILFDIDGVIVRGKNVLPSAPHAFQRYCVCSFDVS